MTNYETCNKYFVTVLCCTFEIKFQSWFSTEDLSLQIQMKSFYDKYFQQHTEGNKVLYIIMK